jgi:tetratricopeptide (TPR) repeat protein
MDMRTPEPFGAQELWLAGAMGQGVPLARVQERWGVDLVLAHRDRALAADLRADPAGFAPVYADAWFVLYAHERALGPARQHLRLASLGLLEDLEAGRVPLGTPLDEPVKVQLRAEAERLRDAWPANNLAQRALLWLLLSEGRFLEAHARAVELGRAMPRQALYPFFEGVALRQLGKAEDAVAAFRRAMAIAPEFLLPYPQAADLLLALGRNQEAVALLERYAYGRWSRLSAAEYILLGRARARTGRSAAAEDAFARADWLLPAGDPLRAELDRERVSPAGAGPSPR